MAFSPGEHVCGEEETLLCPLGSFAGLIFQPTGDRLDQQEEIMKFNYVQTYGNPHT